MMTITQDEFVNDYNEYYQCNFKVVKINTNDLPEVMYNLYNTDDFEIDYDKETIELLVDCETNFKN